MPVRSVFFTARQFVWGFESQMTLIIDSRPVTWRDVNRRRSQIRMCNGTSKYEGCSLGLSWSLGARRSNWVTRSAGQDKVLQGQRQIQQQDKGNLHDRVHCIHSRSEFDLRLEDAWNLDLHGRVHFPIGLERFFTTANVPRCKFKVGLVWIYIYIGPCLTWAVLGHTTTR